MRREGGKELEKLRRRGHEQKPRASKGRLRMTKTAASCLFAVTKKIVFIVIANLRNEGVAII